MNTRLAVFPTVSNLVHLKHDIRNAHQGFRKITKSNGNNLFNLVICVYRPIECLFEPFVMYINIFYVD